MGDSGAAAGERGEGGGENLCDERLKSMRRVEVTAWKGMGTRENCPHAASAVVGEWSP